MIHFLEAPTVTNIHCYITFGQAKVNANSYMFKVGKAMPTKLVVDVDVYESRKGWIQICQRCMYRAAFAFVIYYIGMSEGVNGF